MRIARWFALLAMAVSLGLPALSATAAQEVQRQALPSDQDWPDTDVAYIITDEEKAAWKGLRTAEERDQFIEQVSRFLTGTGHAKSDGAAEEFKPLQHYVPLKKAPPVKFKDLESVVTSKVVYDLMPFQVHTDFIKSTNATVLAMVMLQFANKNLTFRSKNGIEHAMVSVHAIVSTMTYHVTQSFEDVIPVERKSSYFHALTLRPGRYRMCVVLKDARSGYVGAIEEEIVVPRFDDATLSSSSLILSGRDIGKGQFVLGTTQVHPIGYEIPRNAGKLSFYLQVYNLAIDQGTKKSSASIEYRLLRIGDPTGADLVLLTRETAASLRQMMLGRALPLEALAPGRYVLHVKVTDNVAKKSIAPSATFAVQ